jgi:ADP-glucose pyrophosphorylase
MVANDKVYAYPFSGYWVDVGIISSYWETNLALLQRSQGSICTTPVGCSTHARKSALL